MSWKIFYSDISQLMFLLLMVMDLQYLKVIMTQIIMTYNSANQLKVIHIAIQIN